jgi:hypothetical protein
VSGGPALYSGAVELSRVEPRPALETGEKSEIAAGRGKLAKSDDLLHGATDDGVRVTADSRTGQDRA